MKCDSCGQFISCADLTKGFATHRLVTPDSEFSAETFETLCRVCNEIEHPSDTSLEDGFYNSCGECL
jgi:hypothetical protein